MMNPVTVRAPAQKIWDELGFHTKKLVKDCIHQDHMQFQN